MSGGKIPARKRRKNEWGTLVNQLNFNELLILRPMERFEIKRFKISQVLKQPFPEFFPGKLGQAVRAYRCLPENGPGGWIEQDLSFLGSVP